MPKIDVLLEPGESEARHVVKAQIGRFTFWLLPQDAFDESRVQEIAAKLCNVYLGPVEKANRRQGVVKRGEPLKPFPPVNGKAVALSETLFGTVAGLVVMQDWEGHASECYEPEEIIHIAAKWPKVWAQLLEAASDVNSGSIRGNEWPEADVEPESEQPSGT